MVLLEKRSSPYRSPYRDLELLDRQFNWLLKPLPFGPALTPAADVYENGDEIVVELEVPGYEQDRAERRGERSHGRDQRSSGEEGPGRAPSKRAQDVHLRTPIRASREHGHRPPRRDLWKGSAHAPHPEGAAGHGQGADPTCVADRRGRGGASRRGLAPPPTPADPPSDPCMRRRSSISEGARYPDSANLTGHDLPSKPARETPHQPCQ